MTVDSRLVFQLLEGIDLFKGFTTDELWSLLEAGVWEKAPAGGKILSAGALDLHMYVMVEGRAEVIFNRKVLAVLEAGDAFGEFGLMGQRRSADVVAAEPCLLLRFNAESLNDLELDLQVKLLKRILVSLMIRLQDVNRHLFWNLRTHWK
ncbi:MAG: cyclic nucleotide-binding domain-containing protein [Thermodesulfobacteriota bacterium]